MTFVPTNGTVLAKPVLEKNVASGTIIYEEPKLPFFEILAVSNGEEFWKVGDLVVSNSTGTKVKDGGQDMYLFNRENLVARKKT